MSRFEGLGCIFQLLIYTMAWVKECQGESILICNADWPDKVDLVFRIVRGCDLAMGGMRAFTMSVGM